jgi:branched-subunit amino acid ABC-type transport system permease component
MLQLLVSGLALGAIYGLVAMGSVAIYRTTRVFNFAQGDLLMLAAAIALGAYSVLHLPVVLAILVTFVAMALAGIVLNRVAVRPIVPHGSFAGTIVSTLAVGIILESGANIVLANGRLAFPEYLTQLTGLPQVVRVAGAAVGIEELAIFMAAISVGLAAEWLYEHSWLGACIKATSQDPVMAQLLGIPTRRFVDVSFAFGAVLACAGGVLVAPITSVYPFMGVDFGVKGFAALVVGGVGSAKGALAGGVLIGLTETLAAYYVGAPFKVTVALLLTMAILLTRPSGLFGRQTVQKM